MRRSNLNPSIRNGWKQKCETVLPNDCLSEFLKHVLRFMYDLDRVEFQLHSTSDTKIVKLLQQLTEL